MFKRNIISFSLAILTVLISAGVFSAYAQQETSQVDVDKKEIGTFVKAAKKVQKLQGESEQDMIEAIEGEGFETDRYIEIVKMDKNAETNAEKEISEEEFEKYSKARKKVTKIQQKLEKKQVEAIESEGLEVERYVEIAKAARQDPELGKKIRTELQK